MFGRAFGWGPRFGFRRPWRREPGLRGLGFRGRVFGLVVLVALVATGATAWLTARTATAQLTESAAVQEETAAMIYRTLTGYGADHGTWEGVDRTVRALGERAGQRIRLTTLDGEVIADTDTLSGRTARPPSRRPGTVLDPRPLPPTAPPWAERADAEKEKERERERERAQRTGTERSPVFATDLAMAKVLMSYRSGIRLAACLTRAGAPVRRDTQEDGIWTFLPGASADPGVVRECSERAQSSEAETRADLNGALRCATKAIPRPSIGASAVPAAPPATGDPGGTDSAGPGGSGSRCMEQLFVDRLESVTPVPLQLKLGFGTDGSRPPRISPGRVLTAAGAVAILVIAATMLLSRRVLAPIAALSRASLRLGAGDLSERVRVAGSDEISELAASFNRMADSLQRSEERQRRMISDIAHELRTPLSNIRGYLEALHDGVLSPDPDLFASLHEEAVLQQRLIDDLQELVLAESGTLPLHRSPLDLAELVEVCGAAHRASAAAAEVRLEVAPLGAVEPLEADSLAEAGLGAGFLAAAGATGAAAGTPLPVDGDPDRLRQVIGNLVTNAVRATPAGGRVVLRAFRDGPDAVITVRDTGHGIAAEDVPHVFDRFWRADSARGRRTGGRGLGLAIAREIVLAHGGTLSADSAVGVGSTFTIRLPAGLPPQS